jgi:putative zinc finger/helix-turn-helix YgiT family protein
MNTSRGDAECAEHTAQSHCPNCDSTNVESRSMVDRFRYGVGDNAVELTATIPVNHCRDCDLEYSGADAERVRHEVICEHLRLLPPQRIAAVRASYGVSRAKFAEITRIGMATLARWENGEILQNAAMDMYMRLLARQEIYNLVASRALLDDHAASVTPPPTSPTFRAFESRGLNERTRIRAAAPLFDFAPKISEAA